MDRVQLVLLGLPILLFCSDLVTLFGPEQLPTAKPEQPHPHHQPDPTSDGALQPDADGAADAGDPAQIAEPQVDGPASGTTVELKFCASCSYRFGMVPPPWYYSLRANRFGTMATIWLFGNFAQSFLQSSGAFEVYCNGQLVFSKLSEQRFPSEFELRELIGNRLPDSQFGKNLEKVWS
uniref:SelT/selW/selH selenoprotein domain-containing protein n=1 Tax=Leersia perrieri TaxID=77586 RepID=A0A0D9V7F6_9ORYZ